MRVWSPPSSSILRHVLDIACCYLSLRLVCLLSENASFFETDPSIFTSHSTQVQMHMLLFIHHGYYATRAGRLIYHPHASLNLPCGNEFPSVVSLATHAAVCTYIPSTKCHTYTHMHILAYFLTAECSQRVSFAAYS